MTHRTDADDSGSDDGPGGAQPSPPAPHGTLAERLRRLIDWYGQSYGERPSAAGIARAVAAGGGRMSNTTVSQIMDGSNENPQLHTIIELARFFGVDPSYFVTQALDGPIGAESQLTTEQRLEHIARMSPAARAQVELLLAMREAGITRLGARGFVPTGPGREAMLRIVRGVGRLSASEQAAVVGVVEAMEHSKVRQPDQPPVE